MTYAASQSAWKRWTPNAPTSPHWYTPAQFRDLLAAFVHADRQTEAGARLLSTFLAEFDGFAGSAPQGDVLRALGLRRASLEALVQDGTINRQLAGDLLQAMQARARPIAPKYLGILGETHLRAALTEGWGVDANTIRAGKTLGVAEHLPYVLEVACGWQTEDTEEERGQQRCCGVNFAPTLGVPWPALYGWCDTAQLDDEDPVTLVAHITCPWLQATDRGKRAVTLPEKVEEEFQALVLKMVEPWTKLKAKIRREGRRHALAEERARQTTRPMTTKAAAWQVMEEAYLLASDAGRLPANARQIMYAARPLIIALTGNPQPWKNSAYFTQTLLPNFVAEHPERTADWDVVYDARGHFREPHTTYEFGIGTVEVRRYLSLWTSRPATSVTSPQLSHAVHTWGPACRYQYALFVEKEGFDPLLERAQIQERYDVALMSTKGMTVTSARRLVQALSEAGVTILVVHDFDKSGLEILDKFTSDTRRFQYTTPPTVVDLGLTLEDALAMGLESEPVQYDQEMDPAVSLRACGATEDACAFLVRERMVDTKNGKRHVYWVGERIELNAMTSQQFLDWLERKLREAGVQKVVPDEDVLAAAYLRQRRIAHLQKLLDAALTAAEEEAPVPVNLTAAVRAGVTQHPTSAWDDVLWDMVQDQSEEGE